MRSWLRLIAAGLLGIAGCNDLWGDQSRDNPNNCVVMGGTCPSGTVCSPVSERCEAAVMDLSAPPDMPAAASLSFVAVEPPLAVAGARGMVVGDLNRDNKPDLVVATTGSQGVALLLGQGSGTFRAVNPDKEVAGSAGAAAIGDVNADGLMDVAVTVTSGGYVPIVQAPAGTFTLQPAVSSLGQPADLLLRDVTGDGKADVVVLSGMGGVRVHKQGGAEIFTTSTCPGRRFLAEDLNRDGKADLAVACRTPMGLSDGKVQILLGQGNGAFSSSDIGISNARLSSVTSADFNGDALVDLLVGDSQIESAGQAYVLLGAGNGAFSTPQVLRVSALPSNLLLDEEFLVAAADLDLDGRPEAVISMGGLAARVALFSSRGGAFTERSLSGVMLGARPTGLVAGDFDGDRRIDLALALVRPGDDVVRVLLNTTQ